jgi:hypothetical protein
MDFEGLCTHSNYTNGVTIATEKIFEVNSGPIFPTW